MKACAMPRLPSWFCATSAITEHEFPGRGSASQLIGSSLPSRWARNSAHSSSRGSSMLATGSSITTPTQSLFMGSRSLTHGVTGCRVANPVSGVVGRERLPRGERCALLGAVQRETVLLIELHDLLRRVVSRDAADCRSCAMASLDHLPNRAFDIFGAPQWRRGLQQDRDVETAAVVLLAREPRVSPRLDGRREIAREFGGSHERGRRVHSCVLPRRSSRRLC